MLYLAVVQRNLFTRGLKTGPIMSQGATMKHGGGHLQIWGCISVNGVGDLVRINGV